MGHSSSSSSQRFLDDWTQIQKEGVPGSMTNLWAKKSNPKIQMEQYHLHVTSKEEVEKQRKIHQLRHNHPQLVSSLHFVDQTEEQFCSSSYQGKIYIERIPLNLQTVTDIPFPDALHVYSQSLQGFHILASQVQNGCFPISQEHIGISSESVCKVWMNNKHERNYPSSNQKIPEERMVRNILESIQQNIDLGSLQGKPKPSQYIYNRSRSPAEVRFGQAINLLRNYTNEYFGGVIPQKLSCVQMVGGAFQLQKNWKHRNNLQKTFNRLNEGHDEASNLPQTKTSGSIQLVSSSGFNSTANNVYPSGSIVQTRTAAFRSDNQSSFQPNQNSYTTFKRQQPIIRASSYDTPVGSIYRNQQTFANTPSFEHQSNFGQSSRMEFTRNNVQLPRPSLVVQNAQIINRNQSLNSTVGKPHFFNRNFYQQPLPIQQFAVNKNPVNNYVRANITPIPPVSQTTTVMKRSTINFVTNNGPQTTLKQSFIQNRVVNAQFAQIQGPLPQIIQNQPIRTQSVLINQPIQGANQQMQAVNQQQHVTVNQQPGTFNIQKSAFNFVNSNQGVSFRQADQSQPQLQPVRNPQNYFQPGVVSHNQPQKVDSKLVLLSPSSPLKNPHMLNNQESISSINAQTNPIRSNQQLSDKYSMIKQQPMDSSTRNFYTNMLNNGESGSRTVQNQDQYTGGSYYKAYISKLYDNQNDGQAYVSKAKVKDNYISSSNKYDVTIDDGMSSAAFLNELKNMKFPSQAGGSVNSDLYAPSASTFKKTDNNFQYGTTYQPTFIANARTYPIDPQHTAYKVDHKAYNTTLTDGIHHNTDLIVIGQQINMTPIHAFNKYLSQQPSTQDQHNQYRLSYEYEQGSTPAGNIRYESEHVKVDGDNGAYEEEYFEQTDYQSTFDRYARMGQGESYEREDGEIRLGGDIRTQQSRANEVYADGEFQNSKQSANTTAFHPNYNSPSIDEQYKVQFDPEILADLQKLKGVI